MARSETATSTRPDIASSVIVSESEMSATAPAPTVKRMVRIAEMRRHGPPRSAHPRSWGGALEHDEHLAGTRLGGEGRGSRLCRIVGVVADLEPVPLQAIDPQPDLALRLTSGVGEV